jgi:hypothetical protein
MIRLALCRLLVALVGEHAYSDGRRRAPWRVTLWAAERRYRAAERARGREYAKRYDYIPF